MVMFRDLVTIRHWKKACAGRSSEKKCLTAYLLVRIIEGGKGRLHAFVLGYLYELP